MSAVLDAVRQPVLSTAGAPIREMLSFAVGREHYAIDILKVQEIRGYEPPTRIASAPESLKGVINLRGVIVPIVDLRMRLGCGQPTYDASTVVIILSLSDRMAGIVVDSVSDVVALDDEQVKPAPEFEANAASTFVRGLATVGERMLIVVDIEGMLGDGLVRNAR